MYTYTTFNELTAFLVFTQMMLDYHIGAASIARSLASYIVNILDLIPSVKDNIPNWVGHGGDDIFGFLSFNILAPILLVLLTILLCRGVGESTLVNTVMTMTKVICHYHYHCHCHCQCHCQSQCHCQCIIKVIFFFLAHDDR